MFLLECNDYITNNELEQLRKYFSNFKFSEEI